MQCPVRCNLTPSLAVSLFSQLLLRHDRMTELVIGLADVVVDTNTNNTDQDADVVVVVVANLLDDAAQTLAAWTFIEQYSLKRLEYWAWVYVTRDDQLLVTIS
jgi:hypothetical protein